MKIQSILLNNTFIFYLFIKEEDGFKNLFKKHKLYQGGFLDALFLAIFTYFFSVKA